MKKKIISVVGARPNFMKVAPLHKEFSKYTDKIEHLICHTGQHFDEKMSKVFFDELELPKPDFYLGVSGGSHAVQTAGVMLKFEKVLLAEKPDLVIVVGDVNSTLACSITAAKLNVKVAHVEAGLRSFDRNMPEEINRLVTDSVSDLLFVSEPSGMAHLKAEGIPDEKLFFAGNVMIDSLQHYLSKSDSSDILLSLGVKFGNYVLATFHRPSNVDELVALERLVDFLNELAKFEKVVFPIHPRTLSNLKNAKLYESLNTNIILCDPVGYIDFIALQKNAKLVVTDSGGIQEETTVLGVQCITVRDNTERPVTVDVGTNQLIGTDYGSVLDASKSVLEGNLKAGSIPELWDGKAGRRIVAILMNNLSK